MKLQVLVTTMHQTDLSIAKRMNISGAVLFANQADRYDYVRSEREGGTVEMVTTPTRGTSKNRNIALECSSPETEYIVFSDDDLVFKDDYERLILQEFEVHPEAEAIKFNLYNICNERKIAMRRIEKYRKATRRSVSASGVWALAIRRDVLMRKNLRFNEAFGPGTEDFCGEDTIFLQELIQKKVKFYLSPVEIAGIDQAESCWFEGYTDKYFRVSGKILAACYPRLAGLLAVRSAYRFHKRQPSSPFRHILRCYREGIKEYLK